MQALSKWYLIFATFTHITHHTLQYDMMHNLNEIEHKSHINKNWINLQKVIFICV